MSAKPDLFAVAGGDGTVNRVFKELAGSSTPVTVIPLGTANNIAGTLGLAGASAEELIAAWPDFVPRLFDVGEASAEWGTRQFVETAGAGLLAELFRSADEQDEPEDKVRHGLELLRAALAVARADRWQLELDGADLSGELIGVEAMNIREVGPELALAPSADPGDGLLDVVLIADEHRDALRAHVEARLGGTHAELPDAERTPRPRADTGAAARHGAARRRRSVADRSRRACRRTRGRSAGQRPRACAACTPRALATTPTLRLVEQLSA